ncbi:MAG TPA: potassium channel protein [Trueperaceae bacterium]|nr:potassium channel protein [Trueperaceae bacterium]
MNKQSHETLSFIRQIRFPLALLFIVLVFGSLAYHALWQEYNATWLESIFMTFITVTSIGYGLDHPLNNLGRVLTMLIAISGMGSLFYLLSSVMEYLVARGLSDPFGRRKMQREVSNLRQHVIVAGFGRLGQRIVEELAEENLKFVVIDKDDHLAEQCLEKGYLFLKGDAEEDNILLKAGLKKAKAIIIATGNDADNAFIAMTARALNDKIFIVSKADSDNAVRKLKKAGADRVVNPYAIAGQRLVNIVVRPVALEFMSHTMQSKDSGLSIQEFHVLADSPFANKTLLQIELRKKYGLNVVAVIRDGKNIVNPDANLIIEPADQLIMMGTEEQFDNLNNSVAGALAKASN